MTEREKGTYFEELIRTTYFRNKPRFADLYSDVWLFADRANAHGFSAKDTQTGQTGAIGTRFDRNALVEQATERRMWLQFAADAEWPHTNPSNTPIRREFLLPANRAFKG